MSYEYHVAVFGDDRNEGSAEKPFATINHAAQLARAGDVVIVHDGEYRESVHPKNSGLNDCERIIYRAAEGEHPVIKGSERVDWWVHIHDGIWEAVVPNTLFGDFNPFLEGVFGDWLIVPNKDEPAKHLGDVYLNGMSFYEVDSFDDVEFPEEKTRIHDYVTDKDAPVLNVPQTTYVWHAETDKDATVIRANFHEHNPNNELVEINVRQTCFSPNECQINYITVSGFEMCQAATPWAPPTSPQVGMISANWSRGWIIENNVFHDAKCAAISLGKERSTGDNEWYRTERKNGYQYQLEAVFKGLRIGWTKDVVGGHMVRWNEIYNCGQNAIVGHMGCAFSNISHNHIYRIGIKREFFGWEIAGIKFHAAIDTIIAHNNIHDCSLGIWLDWEAQGTRISSNVLHRNNRDLMIEVSHGPCVVDNNILGSDYSFENFAQGSAFINNLICGITNLLTVLDRSTPYHFPHTTAVTGCSFVFGGDDRFINNIFVARNDIKDNMRQSGLGSYAGYPRNMREYVQSVHEEIAQGVQGGGDPRPVQPIYPKGNVYLHGALPAEQEEGFIQDHSDPAISIVETDGGVELRVTATGIIAGLHRPIVTTHDLGVPRVVEARYDNPDGSVMRIDTDIRGELRDPMGSSPGPISKISEGAQSVLVWKRFNTQK